MLAAIWPVVAALVVSPLPRPLASARTAPHVSARCPSPRALDDDAYSVLGVQPTATAAQIKQAYRRLALRSHPDVNKAPDAQAEFARIAEAYSILSDTEQRRKYDRGGGTRRRSASSSTSSSSRSSSSASSSPWSGFDPSDPTGWATRPRDPAAETAAAERRRKWREENPMPDELGDSFGSLFGDVISAVGQAVSGSGDWLSLLDELQLTEGPELLTLLRSRDAEQLQEELESARWVQATLKSRIDRLNSEYKAAETDAANLRRDGASARAAGGMARSLEREMQRDLRRRRQRLSDAKRLLTQAREREQRITARLDELRRGGGGDRGRRRSLPSVDDELEQMKRRMGR
jgi:curved DNA-binding protein CbpA